MAARSTKRAAKPPPDPTTLKREAAGRYTTGDGRFSVEQASGGWMVIDTEQTNELGLPLIRGPLATLDDARAAIETARAGPAPTSALAERVAARQLRKPLGPAGRSTGRAGRTLTPVGPAAASAIPPRAPEPPPILVREFRAGDGERLRALWAEAGFPSVGGDDASLRRFAQRNPGLLLVATQGQAIVGSALGGWDGRRGWIYDVATTAGHRHRGLATRLVRQVEARLRELGAPRVNVIVRADDPEAARFWEAIGYTSAPTRQFSRDLGAE